MKALADSGVLWLLLVAVLAVVYFLPTLIGLIRGVDRLALVFLVNLIGAPALIGWPAAMILAFGPRRLPPEPVWPRHPGMTHGPTGIRPPGSWDQR
jgi:hypothetical protein